MLHECSLWSDADLIKAARGWDLWLTTILLNQDHHGEEARSAYNEARRRGLIKAYKANWHKCEMFPEFEFLAPNDEMAIAWLRANYAELPAFLEEEITTRRRVELPLS